MKNKNWENLGSKFSHLLSVHPCYSEKAHFKTARIHLPVAPKCNIQCKFCSRTKNKCEYRPGAYSHLLKPSGAIHKVKEAIKEHKTLKVVGIAGPGEPLFNDETFETFKLINNEFPDLHKCVATNGLLLPEKIELLHEYGVGSITVTINGIDPNIVSQVTEWVFHDGVVHKGVDGAKILTSNQLKGIELAYDMDIPVKINTVLIPSINAKEIERIAQEASERGAWIMNIIPLIPVNRFKDLDAPTCDDLKAAREIAEQYIQQFRLCRQCRADSVGVPGKEHHDKGATSEYFHG